jgi:hypothetical protein
VLSTQEARERIKPYTDGNGIYLSINAPASNGDPGAFTWYLGGTTPLWNGAPYAVALLLEEADPELAARLGDKVLQAAMGYNR